MRCQRGGRLQRDVVVRVPARAPTYACAYLRTEDFRRLNERCRVHFRGNFQRRITQIEYSHTIEKNIDNTHAIVRSVFQNLRLRSIQSRPFTNQCMLSEAMHCMRSVAVMFVREISHVYKAMLLGDA